MAQTPTYGEIAQSWPRIARAVNEACRVPAADRSRGHTRPDLTRAQAEAAAVRLATREDTHLYGGWTVGQLRQALVREAEVAS